MSLLHVRHFAVSLMAVSVPVTCASAAANEPTAVPTQTATAQPRPQRLFSNSPRRPTKQLEIGRQGSDFELRNTIYDPRMVFLAHCLAALRGRREWGATGFDRQDECASILRSGVLLQRYLCGSLGLYQETPFPGGCTVIRFRVLTSLLLACLPVGVVTGQGTPGGPDRVACAAQPGCAAILKPFEARELAALSDSARLLAAVMQSSAALAAQRPGFAVQFAGAGYCFKTRTPSDSTLVGIAAAPMQARLPRLRWCRSDEALPNPPRRGRILPEPGTQIVGLSMVSVTAIGDSATTRLTIGSTMYECREVRQTAIWRPQSCVRIGGS